MDVEKTIEFILEQQANVAVHQAKAAEEMAKFSAGLERLDRRLDRAVKLGIREARHERKRHQELTASQAAMDARLTAAQSTLDEKLTQLAAAQLLTEESLRAFIDSMRRGGNGSH
jgi:hypothetical protein